jgi:hypothetical protein
VSQPTADPPPEGDERPSSRRATVALGLAVASTITFTLLRTTVAGTSDVARSITNGHDMALMGTVVAFTVGLACTVFAIVLGVRALAEGAGRNRALMAMALGLASPIAAAALTALTPSQG